MSRCNFWEWHISTPTPPPPLPQIVSCAFYILFSIFPLNNFHTEMNREPWTTLYKNPNYWWAILEEMVVMGSAPGVKQVDGPLRTRICWGPYTFASPILLTNAHRCSNWISCGTRCYLSFLAPLRRHLAMFSRHDINSPKEARSLTDSPYWNLTDNDFVFAEAGAPWGCWGGGRNGLWALCFQNPP